MDAESLRGRSVGRELDYGRKGGVFVPALIVLVFHDRRSHGRYSARIAEFKLETFGRAAGTDVY